MKKIIMLMTAVLLAASASLFPAQIAGDVPPEQAKKILRDLNIMEGILEDQLRDAKSGEISYKFSVDALYYKGIGVIFTVNNNMLGLPFDVEKIIESIPPIPAIPALPDINISFHDDKEDNGKSIRVENERMRQEMDMQRAKYDSLKKAFEKEKQVIRMKQQARTEDIQKAVDSWKKTVEDFFVRYLAGIRNIDQKDKIMIDLNLPKFSGDENSRPAESITFSCSYDDIRDFRREKMSEKDFRKTITSHMSRKNAALDGDIARFREILWQLAVDDPFWMFTSRVGDVYVDDVGVIYTFSTYMVGKSLQEFKALAKDIWFDGDENEYKKSMDELSKEEQKRRTNLTRTLLETSGSYIHMLQNLPDNQSLICLFDMSDSRYGLEDGSLMIKVKKSDLEDFYREKIDLDALVKKSDVNFSIRQK